MRLWILFLPFRLYINMDKATRLERTRFDIKGDY
jgi:hypothetical protein